MYRIKPWLSSTISIRNSKLGFVANMSIGSKGTAYKSSHTLSDSDLIDIYLKQKESRVENARNKLNLVDKI